ncbi:hypothetical protein CF326_g9922, partial [Tilletia indica]
MLGAFFESDTDVLAASSSSTLVPFMVDSGASQHIVDRADVLINVRKTGKPLSFKTVGSRQASDKIGDVTGFLASGRRITFQGVVLLPGAGVNLLSEELLPPATSHLAPAQDVKSSPALDIHVRLGHLAFSAIKKLVRSGHLPSVPGLLDDKPWCDSCEATKATRRPFNDSPLPATAPGEIIVTDVAGPLVACFGGFRYYATFIDEYSKWTKVDLLRSKAEVFHRLVEFVKVAERVFSNKVQVIRTDGGGEYVNKHMSAW